MLFAMRAATTPRTANCTVAEDDDGRTASKLPVRFDRKCELESYSTDWPVRANPTDRTDRALAQFICC